MPRGDYAKKDSKANIVAPKHTGGKSTIKGVSSGKKGVDPFEFANKIPTGK